MLSNKTTGSEVIIFPIYEDDEQERFSDATKKAIVALCSAACFLTPMAGMAFLPAVSIIADTFHTTGSVINISNAIYNIGMALSSVWASFSDVYGRRPAFLICISFYVISSLLVAFSQNLAMFFVFRATTAFFGTAFFSIGAQMIGDIYSPAKRGSAMGYNIAGSQIGPPLGPTIGGIIVTYTSWRVIFYVLTGLGAIVLVIAFFFLPETLEETKYQKALREYNNQEKVLEDPNQAKKFIFLPFNILDSVYSLRYPTLLLGGIASSALMYNMYCLLTPIRYVVDPRFGLTRPIYGGLFYLAPGFGYFVGSLIGGHLSDYQVKRSILKRHGTRIAEDRLRITVIPFCLFSPVSILIYGWCLYFEKGGYAVPIIFMVVNGFCQTATFPTITSYCVDSMNSRIGGAAVGGNYFIRFLAAALASGTCLTSINNIGIGWTSTISAFVLISGACSMLCLMFFGQKLRGA